MCCSWNLSDKALQSSANPQGANYQIIKHVSRERERTCMTAEIFLQFPYFDVFHSNFVQAESRQRSFPSDTNWKAFL